HLDRSVRHPDRRHRGWREQRADSGGNSNGAGFDAKGYDKPPGSPPDFEGASISVISVRAGGFEPPRCRHQQDLNLPRMPFRHARWGPARGWPLPRYRLGADLGPQAGDVTGGLDAVQGLLDST